ncbi:hypothetical protein PILCRDRAFT_87981 [Piloderma croceum F 1598]|uniref:Uncharacterized protein n=1 Tax=Piloderma croceum (strain F 1598) TaxID=765440 RepID=A0A0C3FVL9_PILCF|nr:hypothetical protein PILCRDRAFT_87981 [Piloderma croceum F 1598]
MPCSKRSNLQQAHSLGNINTIQNADKENSPPPLSPASSAIDGTLLAIEHELTHQTIQANKYEHNYRLERWKNKQSQVQNNKLCTNVAQAAQNHLKTQVHLKESITQELGVPVDHVESVISVVNESHGVSTKGNMSHQTALHIILEGGVTSKLQVVEETLVADSKSSGTINKFYSQCLGGDPGAMMAVPADRFFGISSTPNHTSKTQLEGWQQVVHKFYDLYNDTVLDAPMHAWLAEFAAKIKGMHTNHAEDQKSWHSWFSTGKSSVNLLPILVEEALQKVADAGGTNAWVMLLEKEKADCEAVVYQKICFCFGQAAYDALTKKEKKKEKKEGCCMHKELNSMKGGNASLMAFWKKDGIQGPMPLMNHDNVAAFALGSSAAKSRAENITQAGSVKTISLAGVLSTIRMTRRVIMTYLEISSS